MELIFMLVGTLLSVPGGFGLCYLAERIATHLAFRGEKEIPSFKEMMGDPEYRPYLINGIFSGSTLCFCLFVLAYVFWIN